MATYLLNTLYYNNLVKSITNKKIGGKTMPKSNILWITRTAIFLALLIAFQVISQPWGQLFTGSLVNFVLLAAVLSSGLWCGVAVALISPVLAAMVGIVPPFIQIVPAIMVGNTVLVVIAYLIAKPFWKKGSTLAFFGTTGAILAAAVLKFATLWLLVVKILVPILPGIKPKQIDALSVTFSFPQLVTALIGGAVCLAVIFPLRKAMKVGI